MTPETKTPDSSSQVLKLFQAMTSCTGITYVGQKLIGDPLDVEMFKSTGWTLDEPVQTESVDNVIQYFSPPGALN